MSVILLMTWKHATLRDVQNGHHGTNGPTAVPHASKEHEREHERAIMATLVKLAALVILARLKIVLDQVDHGTNGHHGAPALKHVLVASVLGEEITAAIWHQ